MFSLEPKDMLVFEPNNNVSEPHEFRLIPDSQIPYQTYESAFSIDFRRNNGSSTTKKQIRSPKKLIDDNQESKKTSITRVKHKDIERRRRQEMSKLHASLRSLIPPELIKGKRSVCDHMQEAVNYIKNLQHNVEELRERKDKMKISLASRSKIGSSYLRTDNFVKVNADIYGIEILINIQGTEFELSRVLMELMDSELHVVSCISTNMNDKFLHKIQVEAGDMTRADLFRLQETLTSIVIN